MNKNGIIVLVLWYTHVVHPLPITNDDLGRTGVGITLIPEESVLFPVNDARPIVLSILPPEKPNLKKHTIEWDPNCKCKDRSKKELVDLCFIQAGILKDVIRDLNQVQLTVQDKYDNLNKLLHNMASDMALNPNKRSNGLIPLIWTHDQRSVRYTEKACH